MSQKLKAGSVELEVAFIQWIKDHAYDPVGAIDQFMKRSDYIRDAVDTVVDHARAKITERAREHLQRLAEDPLFSAQFPMVYGCQSSNGEQIRYTVSLTMDEHEAHWVGRIWSDDRFLGEVRGSGSGPTSSYMELARMHIESQISCPGELGPRLGK